jgi:ribosomal protein S18 acetylase RimI-like enzyme
MTDFEIVDENLRTAMRFFGRATGTGEVASLPGVEAMYSGLNYGVFNIAMLSENPPRDRGLEMCVAEAARYFKTKSLRWSFWLCEDRLDAASRRRAREVLGDFGLRAISHPPGMVANALLPPVKSLPEIESHPVATAQDRRAFAELTSICFEIPYSTAITVYSPESAWKGEYQGFVGIAAGRVVAVMATVVSAGAIGVYSLATHPSYRRKGYAEALMRTVVGEQQRETGTGKIILQSSESGYPLYRRMGFRDVTRFSVYLTK